MSGLGRASNVQGWSDFVKPILFSLKQEWGKNKLHDLEAKRIRAILVESMLQFLVRMGIASEKREMISLALLQIKTASNVHPSRYQAHNAIYATTGGDRSGVHALTPLVSPCVVL
jgi:hypothetical protein